jgi:hypothetical protein
MWLNRMARQLQGNIGRYAGGQSVTAKGRCRQGRFIGLLSVSTAQLFQFLVISFIHNSTGQIYSSSNTYKYKYCINPLCTDYEPHLWA